MTASLERIRLHIPRAKTLALISAHTRLLADFAACRSLTGDEEIAHAAREGSVGLLQLFDKGTQDRKDLEVLICAALRRTPHTPPSTRPPVPSPVGALARHTPRLSREAQVMAFTSSEVLIDEELAGLLGEADRREGVRRADLYLIEASGVITFDMYRATASRAAFFKQACRLGLVSGASVKSDLGVGNRRSSSGALHLDHCPITFFALPRVNELAGTLSDVLVCVNLRSRFSVSDSGRIRYLGAQPAKSVEQFAEAEASARILTIDALRCRARGWGCSGLWGGRSCPVFFHQGLFLSAVRASGRSRPRWMRSAGMS